MEERSCMENLNGNIVEDIYGIKIAFEGYYETLLKINPQSNISELHKDVFVNQLFSQFETVAQITTSTHIDKVMKVVRLLKNRTTADLNAFRNEVISMEEIKLQTVY